MKIDPPDAPNSPLVTDEGGDAESLRDAVRALRSPRPSPEAAARITKHLVAAGALAPGLAPEKLAGSSSAARTASRLGHYKASALVLAVAVGTLVAARGTWTSDAPSVASAGAAATSPAAAPASTAPSGAERDVEAKRMPEIDAPAPVTAVSVDALPSAAPKARASAGAGSSNDGSARTMSERAAAKTATPELLLVRRAQDALVSDPARALSLANEHASLFPGGELTQEREVVAVDALSKLGRREDALLRARALVRKFPRTPYVAHLEKAIGQPLTVHDAHGEAANHDFNSTP